MPKMGCSQAWFSYGVAVAAAHQLHCLVQLSKGISGPACLQQQRPQVALHLDRHLAGRHAGQGTPVDIDRCIGKMAMSQKEVLVALWAALGKYKQTLAGLQPLS